MRTKVIELTIKTDKENQELLEIFNRGTSNLKEMGIVLLEIKVHGSANSLIKAEQKNE